jgi:hypothetical protein
MGDRGRRHQKQAAPRPSSARQTEWRHRHGTDTGSAREGICSKTEPRKAQSKKAGWFQTGQIALLPRHQSLNFSREWVGYVTRFTRALSDFPQPIARDYTRALVAGKIVTLSAIQPDKYRKRVDAYVSINGRDLGDALIAAGLARPYTGGHRAGWCN